jgi:hypothetical protein
MKVSRNMLVGTSLLVGLLSLTAVVSGCGAKTEDIQGLLKSVEGKQLVIQQDDGTTTRISVSDNTTASQMVGSQVTVTTKQADNGPEAEKIEARGEDATTSGAIQSISADSIVIGGQTFKIAKTTILDSGLAVGQTAKVEFIKQADGTMLAKSIETNAADETKPEDTKFTGAIQSIGNGVFVIGGKTFKTDAKTMLDTGLSVGATATVEFTTLPDGSYLATQIETGVSGGVEPGDDKGGGTAVEPGDDKGGGTGGGGGGSGSGSGK